MTSEHSKCDQKKPKCSRCSRLGIDCIGAGQRRYKFITNHDQIAVAAKDDMHTSASITVLHHSPTDLLVASMIDTMKPSTDLRYNLAWSFGPFLEHVPQRLGTNTALDAAVQVIIAAHANHCAHRKNLPDVLVKYSRALTQLRLSLDDALIAQSPETLCAVMLLLLCQVGFESSTKYFDSG